MKPKFNGADLVQGVDTWGVSLLRYSIAFISWRKCELHTIDRKTRTLFTIYKGLSESLMLTDYTYLEKMEVQV